MSYKSLSAKEYAKAVGVGIVTAVVLSAITIVGMKTGVSPLPKPLGLAFASTLLGTDVPLPLGLLFHVAWVTFWAVVYVASFRDRLTFGRAIALGLALWVLVLVAFFPFVGWGFLGLAVSPKLIVGALVPHVLFAALLWALARWAFGVHPADGHRYSGA